MKTKIIVVALFLACLSTPAYTTGLLEAKIAAVAGVAKGAALLGAGALSAKGAVLKGVGSLLAAKGAAINNVLAAAAKPVEVAVPTVVIKPPTKVLKPCGEDASKPLLVPKPIGPLLTGVQLVSKPVLSLLGDRLQGLLTTIQQTIGSSLLSKPVVVNSVQSPIVYRIIRPPKYYPVSIY